MRLRIDGLAVVLAGHRAVDGVDLHVEAGELVGIVGPNGSGKSTLLRAVYRAVRPTAGAVWIGGDDVWALPPRASARRTAVVPQEQASDFGFTVEEIVTMGRGPHKGLLDRDTTTDLAIVRDALARVGMARAGGRAFASLSGGEKQRVLIARALAQQTPVLLLDEPTNHLDIRYQLEVLHLVAGLGPATLAALHDLNLAAAFCHRLYLLHDGRIVATGTPEQVLTPTLIAEVFGVHAVPGIHPTTGRLQLSFALPTTTAEAPTTADAGHLPRQGTPTTTRARKDLDPP
ncbi:ABC transporter ATP-binding protein [Frankia sp. CiP3]|uniref:ABC transporter ATP-binding protein n=1 Tax=Frankia sp. CiP3 TaxID=2880971 RepID=UPI001EF5E96B|nr:ABC transporter ATP-binding protein [Frankia sp. CiP3]